MRFKLIGLICLIMQCNLSCTQHIINKETVQTLDLHRYMGKWFEIARFDHRFEHNLVGATVEYSFLPNGDIEVVNSTIDSSRPMRFSRYPRKAWKSSPGIPPLYGN